jgi:hypothetical protein
MYHTSSSTCPYHLPFYYFFLHHSYSVTSLCSNALTRLLHCHDASKKYKHLCFDFLDQTLQRCLKCRKSDIYNKGKTKLVERLDRGRSVLLKRLVLRDPQLWVVFGIILQGLQYFVYLSIYLSIYNSCGPWPIFRFFNPYTVGRSEPG